MKQVKPKVFLIAKTVIDHPIANEWLDSLGVSSDYDIPDGSVGSQLTMLAGKRCYLSYEPGLNPNVSRVRDDLSEFIENILKVGHGSVIEHTNYTFAVENVSRVFTPEFNRHRAGVAVSEGSMRYIRFDDIPFWMPNSIEAKAGDSPELTRAKYLSRDVFVRAFQQMEDNYKELLEIWDYDNIPDFRTKKKLTSMFRRIIGMGVATGGVWTINLRALRHIFTMRCDPSAEEEITMVCSMMLDKMIEAEPDIFGDFHKVDGYWQPEYRKV